MASQNRLLAIGIGLGDDARRAAFGLGDNLVGVGFGFVDGALLILLRRGDVAIGGKDLARRVDRLQLDLFDENAGAVAVEHVLNAFLCVRLDRLRSVVRMPSIVFRPTTSRMTLSATALTVSRGLRMLNT